MAKTVDYNIRKRAILAAAINRYIKTAEPVASEDIALEFDLSSASIRNIFKELEKEGYLAHPYTSGGRMPTNKGYRYYVDFLLSQMGLLDEEKDKIGREYSKEIKRLEDVMEKTTELLSAVTKHASIVSLFDNEDKFFYRGISLILEQPEFKDAEQIRRLIRLIEDRHSLLEIVNRNFSEKVKVYIGEELDCPDIESCSLVVSSYSVKKRPSGRIAILGPTRMEYTHIIPALEYVSDVLSTVLE